LIISEFPAARQAASGEADESAVAFARGLNLASSLPGTHRGGSIAAFSRAAMSSSRTPQILE